MATLEKIRSKSVLLVVIIAIALLAFILGDAITNGRNLFGNNTTVAKVGGDKIEIQEYQRKHSELAQQLEEMRRQNPQQVSGFDNQMLSQVAIQQLVNEKLLNNAVEATGIKASPEMLRFFMIDHPEALPEEVASSMQTLLISMNQNGMKVNSPQEAYAVIFQPQNYGYTARQVEPYQTAWLAMEAKSGDLIAQSMYTRLLANSFKASKHDVAAARKQYVTAANVKVAKKPYGQLDEKTYPVSDDEIKKAYEEQKKNYAIEEKTKEVSFIAVPVNPSAKDQQESETLAATVVAELKAGNVSKQTRQNGLDIQKMEMRLSDVRNASLKAFLDSAAPGSVARLHASMPGFSVAKFFGRSQHVDTVSLSTITVQGPDSVVKAVLAYANSGSNLDSISGRFAAYQVEYNEPREFPIYNETGTPNKNLGLQETTYDSLYNSNGAYIVIDQVEGAAVLGAITKKSSPKEIVEYETVSYELHPSEATLAEAREKLQKFLTANNTAEKFQKNAQAAGYTAEDLAITPSTAAVPSPFGGFYPDSRPVVRWIVMDGKDGEVSKIYQDKDAAAPKLYAAAILNTYEDYVPWDNKNVKDELTAKIRRDKAGDAMVKQYSKGTVEAAAQAMNVQPVEIASLQSNKHDMTVTDRKVKGRILGSKPSNKLQVVKGDDGVYAYIITAVTEEPVQMDDDAFAAQFVNNMGVQRKLNQTPGIVLKGKKKIENNIYKFEQGE